MRGGCAPRLLLQPLLRQLTDTGHASWLGSARAARSAGRAAPSGVVDSCSPTASAARRAAADVRALPQAAHCFSTWDSSRGADPQQSLQQQRQQRQQRQLGYEHGINAAQDPVASNARFPPGSSAAASDAAMQRFLLQQRQHEIGGSGGGVNHSSSSEALFGAAMAHYEPPATSGASTRRCRRKTPLFQVIEFYASGGAAESFSPRTPQELGLHPRDVTLFAPLSRLAAPQRATITVHDNKILLKTEIVKAIITADKVTLIKGRRQRDTQKLAQAILAANDQRLKAIRLAQHQAEQVASSITPGLDGGSMMGSCERAASAADIIRKASEKHATRSHHPHQQQPALRQVVTTPGGLHYAAGGGSHGSSSGGGGGSHSFSSSSGSASSSASSVGGGWGAGGMLQPSAVASGQVLLAQAAGGGGSAAGEVPFEMLVLEVLLDATAEYFVTKVQHLNWMLESIAADIRNGSSPSGGIDKAHQLLPIQKFMTSLKNDVRETCDAIKAALSDDEMLEDLCLSWHMQQRQHTAWMPVELQRHRAARLEQEQQSGNGNGSSGNGRAGNGDSSRTPAGMTQQVRLLTEMLESYEREIESLEGSVKEAEEDLENTRSIWHMQLDSSRNHIIMVNLWLSMLNISVMATTILPAFFGMNLASGLSEADPSWFYAVCGGSIVLSALSYPVARFWFLRNWKKANQTKLFEQKMLRVLLVQNIEDVDDIIAALRGSRYKHLDKRTFRELMHNTLGNRAMTPTSIDFLWEVYDRDRDGFIAEAEHMRPIYHDAYQDSSSNAATATSSSSSSSSSTATASNPQHHGTVLPQWTPSSGSRQQAPVEYAQQQAMASILPAQLGSLHPPGQQQQQQGSGLAAAAAAAGGLGAAHLAQLQSQHAVRVSPRQPQEQEQEQEQQQEHHQEHEHQHGSQDWVDDDRFSWQEQSDRYD